MKRKKPEKSFSTKKFPLVIITWKDAVSDASWEEPEKIKAWANKDFIVENIGWIVASTKKYIVVCSEITEDGDYGNRTKIPKGWVVKMQPVDVVFKKRRGGK